MIELFPCFPDFEEGFGTNLPAAVLSRSSRFCLEGVHCTGTPGAVESQAFGTESADLVLKSCHLFRALGALAGQPDATGYANGAKRPAASVKRLGCKVAGLVMSVGISESSTRLRKKAAATPATPEGQLLKAARSGSLMSVIRLLQMGVDPNASPLALVQGSGQHFEMRFKAMFVLCGAGSAQRMQTPKRKRTLKLGTGTFRHWNQSSKIHLIPRYHHIVDGC